MAHFHWDENKRQKTLEERGLDFADAEKVFADDYTFSAPDPRYDFDDRWLIIGRLNEKTVVVIAYKETPPGSYRIISMRMAEKQEIARYESEKRQQMPGQDDVLIKLMDKLAEERQVKEQMDSLKKQAEQWREQDSP